MHHIYTTKAFVVHSIPQGEANKFILLFTRDFGMIGATAQGIRLSQSKLRYHLQDGDFSNISIVRGKEVWRITGAHELESFKSNNVHIKILKLLKRLLHGEERNFKLFDIVEYLYNTNIGDEDLETIENITVLRILNELGYIRNIVEFDIFFKNIDLNTEIIEFGNKMKKDMVKVINHALKESHL